MDWPKRARTAAWESGILTLNHTGLNDAGIMAAAAIPKLSHIQIDHTAVTYEGLLAIAENSRIEPVAHEQFTR